MKQYNNSFKRQYIKIVSDIRESGFTPKIELRMRELGIVETETSKEVNFLSDFIFSAQVKVHLCDGCVIIVTQDEIEQLEMTDKKRAVIESNVYARMLNEMIEAAKRRELNEALPTIEARFNNQIKKECQKC